MNPRRALDSARASTTAWSDARVGPFPVRIGSNEAVRLLDAVETLSGSFDDHVAYPPLHIVIADPDAAPPPDLPPGLIAGPTEVCRAEVDGLTVNVSGPEQSIWVLDPEGTAVHWSSGDTPFWEGRSSRVTANWWALRHSGVLLHTAAVADERGAVLIVGDGGAGKSTTAMACLGSSLDVLGDDHNMVTVQPATATASASATVHPTFTTARLDDRSLALLPDLRDRVVGHTFLGKARVELDVTSPAPVRAICKVSQSSSGDSGIERLPAARALHAMAPSTLQQGHLDPAGTWRTMSNLVRVVPAWRLEIVEPDGAPRLLSEMLAASSGARSL